MRLLITSIVLAVVFCIPFAIWGDDFMRLFTGDAAIAWIRGWGAWGWLAVIGRLVSDLFLPIPATPVMSAAGYLYGTLIGGLVSAVGSFAAGMAGYGLCRAFGHNIALHLAGEKELAEHHTLFQRSGSWLVVALACGSIPMGFVYAAVAAEKERGRIVRAPRWLNRTVLGIGLANLFEQRVRAGVEKRLLLAVCFRDKFTCRERRRLC